MGEKKRVSWQNYLASSIGNEFRKRRTAASNGGLDEGVKLLVTADGELKVARGDTLGLEVLGGVAGKLENLVVVKKGRGKRKEKGKDEDVNG